MNDFDKKLDFDSNTFEDMKHDMNFVLQRLLGNMIEKQSNEGSMTIAVFVSSYHGAGAGLTLKGGEVFGRPFIINFFKSDIVYVNIVRIFVIVRQRVQGFRLCREVTYRALYLFCRSFFFVQNPAESFSSYPGVTAVAG